MPEPSAIVYGPPADEMTGGTSVDANAGDNLSAVMIVFVPSFVWR